MTSIAAIRFDLEHAGVDCKPMNPRTTDIGFSLYHLSVIQGELLGDECLHRRKTDSYIFQLSTTTREQTIRLMEKLPDEVFPPVSVEFIHLKKPVN